MSKEELFWRIKRNKCSKNEAIKLISDFLAISRKKAIKLYENEYLQYCQVDKF